jgi:hypothetical protein
MLRIALVGVGLWFAGYVSAAWSLQGLGEQDEI